MKNKIWLSLAHMSGNETKYVNEAFENNWVVPLGPNVNAFETELENYLNADKYVVVLNSGTAALHLGLDLLDIKSGDEVICQSFTFIASANPIKYLGATPIFVDSEDKTWNMDPLLLRQAIVDRKKITGNYPKAIMTVCLYGMPPLMDEILEIADEYGIPVIEDSCEAMGSMYKGKSLGTLGHLGTMSFNGNKMISTSGGGALICDTQAEKDRAMYFATQARQPVPYYEHTEIGYNYRMSNICAGIGRGQMTIVDEHIEHHRMIHDLYVEYFKDINGISVMSSPSEDFFSNYWLSCILVDSPLSTTNEDIRVALEKENIESRLLWKPMHLQPVFKDCPAYVNGVSESCFKKGLCLPSGPMVNKEDIKRIVDIIIKTLK